MKYSGTLKDGLRHGIGKYEFQNPFFRYEGSWLNGRMHGQGVFYMRDGSSYEGTFVNGEIEGRGLRRWPDGSTYNGEFHLGHQEGYGIYIGANGVKYQGHYHNNQYHGKGELNYSNMDFYKGEFKNHNRHGYGIMEYSNGSFYEGEWQFGHREGKGEYHGANGEKYKGSWKMDERDGWGSNEGSQVETLIYDGIWCASRPKDLPTCMVIQSFNELSIKNETDTTVEEQIRFPMPEPMRHKGSPGLVLPTLSIIMCVMDTPPNQSDSLMLEKANHESGRQISVRLVARIQEKQVGEKGKGNAAGSKGKTTASIQIPVQPVEKTSTPPKEQVFFFYTQDMKNCKRIETEEIYDGYVPTEQVILHEIRGETKLLGIKLSESLLAGEYALVFEDITQGAWNCLAKTEIVITIN